MAYSTRERISHVYRSVYATVLDSWLEADADGVLGATYERLPIFG